MSKRTIDLDELLDACLPTVLDDDGHTVYLRHPETSESFPVILYATWTEAETERRQLRRILCGIIGAAIQEYVR